MLIYKLDNHYKQTFVIDYNKMLNFFKFGVENQFNNKRHAYIIYKLSVLSVLEFRTSIMPCILLHSPV